jgi:hypothetical protein
VPPGYPRIVESPSLKAVEKDRNTVMLCSAVGNPDAAISWYKNMIPVDLSDARCRIMPTGQCVNVVGRSVKCNKVNKQKRKHSKSLAASRNFEVNAAG